jgi:hypothetical protein
VKAKRTIAPGSGTAAAAATGVFCIVSVLQTIDAAFSVGLAAR